MRESARLRERKKDAKSRGWRGGIWKSFWIGGRGIDLSAAFAGSLGTTTSRYLLKRRRDGVGNRVWRRLYIYNNKAFKKKKKIQKSVSRVAPPPACLYRWCHPSFGASCGQNFLVKCPNDVTWLKTARWTGIAPIYY